MRFFWLKICLTISALLGSAGSVSASALPACPSSGYFHNCFGTFVFSNGDQYIGDHQNNESHGQGTYIFADGTKYIGQFKNNEFHGQGTLIFESGSRYVGEFKNDNRHGRGTYVFPSGAKYVGDFKDDKKHGHGAYIFASGDKYVGSYEDNKRHGYGLYLFADGAKFAGQFKEGMLNGYAIKFRADGSIYQEGIFKDDEFQYPAKNLQNTGLAACPSSGYFHNCFGSFTYESGSTYVGEFQNDRRHGQGTYIYASGTKYVGEFKNKYPYGQGVYYFLADDEYESDVYVGELKDNKFHGQGAYSYANGDIHIGEFKDDLLNGHAVQYRADGSIYQEGIFKDDEFQYASHTPNKTALPACPSSGYFNNCFGSFTYEDGSYYVGEFKNDQRHGQGTYIYASGSRYEGEFKNNKPNGQGAYYFLADDEFKGDIFVGQFQDSKWNGHGTYRFANGDQYVGEFKNNRAQGQGAYSFSNGDRYEGDFQNGKRHGQGTYFFADGSKHEGAYKNGMLNGYAILYHADGSIYQEGIFKDDEFQYGSDGQNASDDNENIQSDEIIAASSGTGFAVSYDGYVITNHHVIDGCENVVVHTKDNDFDVRVITYDPQNDLALLKGDFRPDTALSLSNRRPELLQDVYVAGFPFGDKFSTHIKVTKGIVSSLTGIGNNFSNIQIDAALQSGNSGGPILDEQGNVIAVAVAKLDAKYMFEEYGVIPENTNFGIKASVVQSVLDSNGIESLAPHEDAMSKSQLGKMISDGTYYISCWMTMAQIQKMKTSKVFFNEIR